MALSRARQRLVIVYGSTVDECGAPMNSVAATYSALVSQVKQPSLENYFADQQHYARQVHATPTIQIKGVEADRPVVRSMFIGRTQ